jgi:IS1 family transposase
LRKKIKQMGISYNRIATDDWDSFLSAFAEDNHDIEKKHMGRIEGKGIATRYAKRSDSFLATLYLRAIFLVF